MMKATFQPKGLCPGCKWRVFHIDLEASEPDAPFYECEGGSTFRSVRGSIPTVLSCREYVAGDLEQ